MMMYLLAVLLLACGINPTPNIGNANLNQKLEKKSAKSLNDCMYILESSIDSLAFNEILSDTSQFIPFSEFNNRPDSRKTYWLWLKIDTFENPSSPLVLKIPKANHLVRLFEIGDDTVYSSNTGFYMAANDEIIPFSNILQIKGRGEISIFLEIKNINDQVPDFSLRLSSLQKEIRKNNITNIIDGLTHGLLWLMIIYGFLLFRLHNDKLYLLYSSYIIFISFWYFGCMATVYRLFPAFPRAIFPFTDIPGVIAAICYILFIRNFAKTSELVPKWDKLLRVLPALLALEILRIMIFLVFTKKVILSYIITDSVLLSIFILLAILSARLLRTKNKLAEITAAGSLILIAGSFIGVALFLSTLNDDMLLIQKFSSVAELLVFTYGISYRYKLIEVSKREIQESLIMQLKVNADLQQKVNLELEEKVKERTFEIHNKNIILQEQKTKIEAINDELNSSIRYASTLQTALLSSTDILDNSMVDYFILFRPLHIVSGDFYWFHKNDGKIIFAVADCTGHGVPGAFMSMLGISTLNGIFKESPGLSSDLALHRMKIDIINALHQNPGCSTRDGMEMSLCILDEKSGIMQFSGASRPLYLIRDGELMQFKGDTMPLGYYEFEDHPFSRVDIKTLKDDRFYLFSDGYSDQMGGDHNRRFRSGNFRKLLSEIHSFPMMEQKDQLNRKIEEWRGSNEQTDDILVLGFKI